MRAFICWYLAGRVSAGALLDWRRRRQWDRHVTQALDLAAGDD